MKMKKNWKRFFTLDRHHAEGFTLVELIVVIAILAILGGVAVPAYSGYVKKAELAGDQQLLATVNTAFASACLENGVDVYLVNSAEIDWGTDGKKTVKGAYVNEINDAFDQAFDAFYSGNENSEFKTEYSIMFDGLRHAFVLLAPGESLALSYGGGYIYVSAEDVQKLADSTFGTKITAQDLMNQVNAVSKFAAVVDSAAFEGVFSDIEYMKSFLKAQGVDTTGMSDTEVGYAWEDKLGEIAEKRYNQMVADAGRELTDKEKEEYAQIASDYVLSNSAILFAANNAKESGDILALLTEERTDGKTPKDVISENMTSDKGIGLSQAAMAYGMYTAYAHHTGDADLIADTKSNYLGVLESLDDPDFQAYLKTEQAKTDMEGYLAAMEMINGSVNDPDAVSSVLINDFNDPELVAALQQMMGQ